MPFDLTYDFSSQCVFARFTGRITMTLVREYITALLPLLEKHDCRRVLSDSRAATLELSALDILQFPKMAEALPLAARCKRAVLAAPGNSGYDMYQILSEMQGHKVRLFANCADAMEWLMREEPEEAEEAE